MPSYFMNIAIGITAVATLIVVVMTIFYRVFCPIIVINRQNSPRITLGFGPTVWPEGEPSQVRLAADQYLTAEKAADISSP